MALQRPEQCRGCPLDSNPKTQGFTLPSGPSASPILLFGEAAGEEEARTGSPFQGAAGSLLNRLLARNHQSRDSFRVGNCIQCRPPGNWFDERAPWYHGALAHCRVHREPVLAEGHPVVVALGATALRTLLHLTGKGIRVEDFHGTVTRDPSDRFWVVPTFHPSFLQRGAMNLFGVCSFDLQQALRVAQEGFTPESPDILVDPPLDWAEWWIAQIEAAVAHDPLGVWLTVDIETPDKSAGQDEGLLSAEDRSYVIVRINFAVHPDEGVSFPYTGPYIALCDRLLRLPCPKLGWNTEYDSPRILAAGHALAGDYWDFMWAWHHLQSDVPRGLGFVAPFYSRFGAWKHLAVAQPGYYAACDGFQTYRVATGIARDLTDLGMWDCFARHTHALHALALKPAQQVGVKIDRERLTLFIADLEVKQRRLLHEMQGLVPEALRPLTPKGGLKRPPEEGRVHAKGTALKKDGTAKKEEPDPIKQELYAQVAAIVSREVQTTGYVCAVCHQQDVGGRHRCSGAPPVVDGTRPWLSLATFTTTRYFWQEPFNPDSPDQILAYIAARGHRPGRAKKTRADSTDRETLTRLTRETGDPLYAAILKSRAVGKVKGTYGVGTLKRLDQDDRIHPTPTFKPSMHRLSYVNTNITNVIADKDEQSGGENLAAGFRTCVVADQELPTWASAPSVHRGTRLFEADFSAIEARLTGYFCQDPEYIRLAGLGVHGALCTYLVDRPYDPTLPDADLAALFKSFKTSDYAMYDRAKHAVYGDLYGQTAYGMVHTFPQSFPTLKIGEKYKRILHQMAPKVPAWQTAVRERAYRQNYLGGPGDHPFGYKHWFWSVLGFRPIPYSLYLKRQRKGEPVTEIQGKSFAVTLGEDAKRVCAFYPQSTAAGILKEAMLRLFDPALPSYIGDAYYGRTPLRAPIHDSLLMEIPTRVWDRVTETVFREMLRPVPELPLGWIAPEVRQRLGLGTHLHIGVAAAAGLDWKGMEGIAVPHWQDLGVSADGVYFGTEDEDEEEVASLGTVA